MQFRVSKSLLAELLSREQGHIPANGKLGKIIDSKVTWWGI